MKREYNIDIFSDKAFDEYQLALANYSETLKSKEFLNFLADKCILELNRISNERLSMINENDIASIEIQKYRNNHKVDIGNDYILISNNTMADLSHVSPKTLENYPDGLSMAQVIEFGTGIWGSPDETYNYMTQVNPNRDYNKSWAYERDGMIYWSKGFGGKFIYYELIETVKKKLPEWLDEFLDRI